MYAQKKRKKKGRAIGKEKKRKAPPPSPRRAELAVEPTLMTVLGMGELRHRRSIYCLDFNPVGGPQLEFHGCA